MIRAFDPISSALIESEPMRHRVFKETTLYRADSTPAPPPATVPNKTFGAVSYSDRCNARQPADGRTDGRKTQ